MLLIEDDRAGAEVLTRLLGKLEHAAKAVENVEEAARTLAAETFDLVLLDNVLPGPTGMQSLSRLRGLTKAPVWIMSGYTDDDTRQDALLLGAAGFLPKPIEISALSAVIERLP